MLTGQLTRPWFALPRRRASQAGPDLTDWKLSGDAEVMGDR
jgi:hypothetical protein